ncbi:hypothetical protein D3C86_1022370 [compost metagenome]
MKLKTRMSVGEALIWNLPSKSVCVPFVVPLMAILTPGSGNPLSSATVPEIVLSCANEICIINARTSVNRPFNFVFIMYRFELVKSNFLIKS